jgi:hypothetical protein
VDIAFELANVILRRLERKYFNTWLLEEFAINSFLRSDSTANKLLLSEYTNNVEKIPSIITSGSATSMVKGINTTLLL